MPDITYAVACTFVYVSTVSERDASDFFSRRQCDAYCVGGLLGSRARGSSVPVSCQRTGLIAMILIIPIC